MRSFLRKTMSCGAVQILVQNNMKYSQTWKSHAPSISGVVVQTGRPAFQVTFNNHSGQSSRLTIIFSKLQSPKTNCYSISDIFSVHIIHRDTIKFAEIWCKILLEMLLNENKITRVCISVFSIWLCTVSYSKLMCLKQGTICFLIK